MFPDFESLNPMITFPPGSFVKKIDDDQTPMGFKFTIISPDNSVFDLIPCGQRADLENYDLSEMLASVGLDLPEAEA